MAMHRIWLLSEVDERAPDPTFLAGFAPEGWKFTADGAIWRKFGQMAAEAPAGAGRKRACPLRPADSRAGRDHLRIEAPIQRLATNEEYDR